MDGNERQTKLDEFNEKLNEHLEILSNCSEDEIREIIQTHVDKLEDYFISQAIPFEMGVLVCQKFCLDSAKTDFMNILAQNESEEDSETEAIIDGKEIPK